MLYAASRNKQRWIERRQFEKELARFLRHLLAPQLQQEPFLVDYMMPAIMRVIPEPNYE